MGLTLFRYIFGDLVRVFLLAAVVIAGILSFAGLLRPLSERGLDGGQVVRMLAWLLPAMATYSLPVAALFATTFVYGRLAADNETTAMRAAGVGTGPLGISFPAVALGLCAGGVSLGLLCFVVPAANLQVERVVYSNLARLSANEVNRTKRLLFKGGGGKLTITADSAAVLSPADVQAAGGAGDDAPLTPQTQVVQLENVYVLRYENYGKKNDRYEVPREIFSARRATAFIEPPGYYRSGDVFETGLNDDRFLLTVVLQDGVKFPRVFEGSENGNAPLVAAVRASQVGPLALSSPVRENTKFLDIRELRTLYARPELSRAVGERLAELAEREQRQLFLAGLRNAAAGPEGATLAADEGRFVLKTYDAIGLVGDTRLNLNIATDAGLIELTQTRGAGDAAETIRVTAPRATVTAEPIKLPAANGTTRDRVLTTFVFEDATVSVQRGDAPAEVTAGRTFERRALADLPADVAAVAGRGVRDFLARTTLSKDDRTPLLRRLVQQRNAVDAEIHSRISFAFSCLALPLVGAALGMLFRSGNFLTAFACSVVPAMLSIVLIVIGQHVAENVPEKLAAVGAGFDWSSPIVIGRVLIWAGNVAVAAAAAALLLRLRRS